MTKGVGSPLITVERSRRETSRAAIQAPTVTRNMTLAAEFGKKAAASIRNTGTLAPQVMKGVVTRVASFSLGLRRVRVAMTPGTAQPPAMPPATMKGSTELPCSPNILNTRSSM